MTKMALEKVMVKSKKRQLDVGVKTPSLQTIMVFLDGSKAVASGWNTANAADKVNTALSDYAPARRDRFTAGAD